MVAIPRLFRVIILLAELVLAGSAVAAEPVGIDPHLGAPFPRRDRPTLGSADAPIIVIEFGNYGCAHCQLFHQTVFPVLRKQYVDTGRVRWVLVPASLDPSGQYHPVFALGRCAQHQGRFWEVLDFLVANAKRSSSRLSEMTGQHPALDQQAFAACMHDRGLEQWIATDFEEFRLFKIQETPTFIIRRPNPDGTFTETRFTGSQSPEYFQRIFDALLAHL